MEDNKKRDWMKDVLILWVEREYKSFQEFIDSPEFAELNVPSEGMDDLELLFLMKQDYAQRGGDDNLEEEDWEEEDWDDEAWDTDGYGASWDRDGNHASWDGNNYADEFADDKSFWRKEELEDEDPEVVERRRRIDELLQGGLNRAFTKMAEEQYKKRPTEIMEHKFSFRFRWKMFWLMHSSKARELAIAKEEAKAREMLRAQETDRAKETDREKEHSRSLLEFLRPARSWKVAVAMAAVMVMMIGIPVDGMNPIIVWMYESWMEQHGDYVEVGGREDDTEISDTSFKEYELTKVPEGYEMQDKAYDEVTEVYRTIYIGEDGQMLIFRQYRKDNTDIGNITANRKAMEKVEVGDFEGYYIQDSNMNSLIISDDQYIFSFTGDFSKAELSELAESLSVAE